MKELPGFPIKLPEAPREHRDFRLWLDEISQRPLHTLGADLDAEDRQPSCGDLVRTTELWAELNDIPIQRAMISRIGYTRTGKRMAYVLPRGASLLPTSGVWLAADDVEADDA